MRRGGHARATSEERRGRAARSAPAWVVSAIAASKTSPTLRAPPRPAPPRPAPPRPAPPRALNSDPLFLYFQFRCAKPELKDRQLASLIDLTKEEFVEGMKRVGVETVAGLKAKMPKVREEVDAKDFKAFHRFVFEVNAAGPPAMRTLEAEAVARFARTCLHRSRFSLLDELLAFLEATPKRAVTKDAWIQLLPFGESFKNKDLSAYDDNAAWPVSDL